MKKVVILILFIFLILNVYAERYIVEVESVDSFLEDKIIKQISSSSVGSKRIGIKGLMVGEKLVVEGSKEEFLETEAIVRIQEDYKVRILGSTYWNYEVIGLNLSKINNSFGRGIKIAVLDTGANFDLLDVNSGYDFVNEDNEASDDNGHGTFVTQILKNRGGLPLAGSEIYAVKVMNEEGVGYVSDIINGINWAINNEIDIVLMSLGGEGDSFFLEEIIEEAYDSGILLIAAVGNGEKIIFPAAYDSVVAMGSVNEDLEKSAFSSEGAELVAPGENILVTDGTNQYLVSGTSFAVPHAGIIASNYWGENLSLTNRGVREKLKETAQDLGIEGRDEEFGWGLVKYENKQVVIQNESENGSLISGIINDVSNEDNLIKPFKEISIQFTFEDNETVSILSDNEGKFELNFYKNITEIKVKKNNCILFEDYSLITFDKSQYLIISIYDKNKCSQYSTLAVNNFAQYGLGPEYPNSIAYLNKNSNPHVIPILLIHGWGNDANSNEGNWGNLEDELENQEYDVWKMSYWPANLSNRKNAGVIKGQISAILSQFYPNKNRLDVISHSMGSLGTRGYIQNMGLSSYGNLMYYNNDIRKYIIIAGPMYGSYFANLLDGTTKNNILFQHPACLDFIKGIIYGLPDWGPDLSGGSEATKDLQIGSDFTWELNNQPLNLDINYLTISGKKLLVQSSGIWLNSQDYCLSNFWETNDGVVSLISSNLISDNYPSILVDRFHSSLPFPMNEVGIADSNRVAQLSSLFIKDQLSSTSANQILNTLGNTGEFYYNPLTSNLIPVELSYGGGIIELKNSQILINDNSLTLKPFNSSESFLMDRNPFTKRWFYTSLTHSLGDYILFTNQLPLQSYELYVNGKNINQLVTIGQGTVSLAEVNLDQDNDNYDLNLAGGTDCNDGNPNIHPGSQEICNGIDDDCDGSVDEDLVRDCGEGSCLGAQICAKGYWSDCSSQGNDAGICASCDCNGNITFNETQNVDCSDGLWCNGEEICFAINICATGTPPDCSVDDLDPIQTCINNPDNNPFTFDFSEGFNSICDEELDSCTNGIINLTHTCNISECGAECELDLDCNNSLCSNQSGCYFGTYREHQDVANTCEGDCVCTDNECSDFNEIITDNDKDGYDIECDGDCNDNDFNIYPNADESICNGIDNDCDVLIDEDYIVTPTSCGIGECSSTGLLECVEGEKIDSCVPGDSVQEICNDGLDNDCDYKIDCDDTDCKNSEYCPDICTIHSLTNGSIYPSRKIPLDIIASEKLEKMEYIDYSNSRPRWRRLCSKCDEYERQKSFNEGEHDIRIRCTPFVGEPEIHEIEFFNDYRKPKIRKTTPKRNKFTNGSNFYIKYTEDNVKNISITYNPTIILDCNKSGRNQECYFDLNLTEFNNQEIEYWFEIEDIAGNKDQSKPTKVKVDTTLPELNNLDSFWEKGEGRYEDYIYFDMNITEINFDEVVLSYEYERRGKFYEKEKRLCSRLKDGKCEDRERIRDYYENLKVIIRDEAGNILQKEINFVVN